MEEELDQFLSHNKKLIPQYSLYVKQEILKKRITDMPWNWYQLSQNEDISLEFMSDTKGIWDWGAASLKSNLTPEFVENNLDKDWNWLYLHLNPVIPDSLVEKYHPEILERSTDGYDRSLCEEKMRISFWHEMSKLDITTSFFRFHAHEPWNFTVLCENFKMDLFIIIEFPDLEWDFPILSKNPKIYEIVNLLPFKNWDFSILSSHQHLPEIAIEDHPYLPWDFPLICSNKYTPLRIIEILNEQNEDLIYWFSISENYNLTSEFVLKYQDKDWDWKTLSTAIFLTSRMILTLSDKEWCWETLSVHRCITPRLIRETLDKPWNFYLLGDHPCMTKSLSVKILRDRGITSKKKPINNPYLNFCVEVYCRRLYLPPNDSSPEKIKELKESKRNSLEIDDLEWFELSEEELSFKIVNIKKLLGF